MVQVIHYHCANATTESGGSSIPTRPGLFWNLLICTYKPVSQVCFFLKKNVCLG